MKKKFKIHRFVFSIIYPDDFPIPIDFLKFELIESDQNTRITIEQDTEYQYTIDVVDVFPPAEGRPVLIKDDLKVYGKAGLEMRYIGIEGLDIIYGYMEEMSSNSARILVRNEFREKFAISTMFTSLLALEKRMLNYNSLILHSSYIEYKGNAILFSAPSGTGKTTQSDLWEQYRGANTVNGDRSLLFQKEGIWYAGGWPVCGTSGVCNNKMLPIKAIVMLSQAKENYAERLAVMKAFSQVYSQITINRWDADVHNKAMNLIEQLIMDIPVYHLACNISEEAVSCLENVVFGEL